MCSDTDCLNFGWSCLDGADFETHFKIYYFLCNVSIRRRMEAEPPDFVAYQISGTLEIFDSPRESNRWTFSGGIGPNPGGPFLGSRIGLLIWSMMIFGPFMRLMFAAFTAASDFDFGCLWYQRYPIFLGCGSCFTMRPVPSRPPHPVSNTHSYGNPCSSPATRTHRNTGRGWVPLWCWITDCPFCFSIKV